MSRLQTELDRLYGLGATAPADPPGIRAFVLELRLPAGWAELSAAWASAQQDLQLPAPAIAVSGVDGLQLWFSLAVPVPEGSAVRFLEGLRERYLAGVADSRVRLVSDARLLPATPPVEVASERWSAFVTPDLASVFADTPWLDIPPGEDAQAGLLRTLETMTPIAFDAALALLDEPIAPPPVAAPAPAAVAPTPAGEADDPVRFLTSVMNDPAAPLALRIEAAKALLPPRRG
jgi:hypothetical protein